MVDFRAVVENLISIGIYDVILPFILVYAIIFAILQKSKIFEGGSSDAKLARSVNAIVALVFGLFIVAAYNIVTIFQDLIVKTVLVVIFLLCLLIVLGFVFGDEYKNLFTEKPAIKYALAAILFLVVFGILMFLLGVFEYLSNWWGGSTFDSDLIVTILVIIGIIGVMVWITRGGSSENKSKS